MADTTIPKTEQQHLSTSLQSAPHVFERIIFFGLITIVAWVPLPLGSNRPWPMALLAILSGVLMALWGMGVILQRIKIQYAVKQIKWPLILFALTCLWIFIQASPLVPEGWQHPIWREAEQALNQSIAGTISINPAKTWQHLFNLLSYFSVFWLSLQIAGQRYYRRAAIKSIIIIGAFYAVYGLVIYLTGNETIIFYDKWASGDSLTSTFVNRNSYATFAGLTLIVTLAVFHRQLNQVLTIDISGRAKMRLIIELLLGQRILYTIVFLIILASLLLTGSRAGILSTCVAIIIFFILISFKSRLTTKQKTITILLPVIIIGIALLSSGDSINERLGQLMTQKISRPIIYDITIQAILRSPWLGTGFGTFPDIFPSLADSRLMIYPMVDKAHNTYLENALELGIPAALFLNVSIALVTLKALIASNKRGARYISLIGPSALILVGLHSLVDFSLQIPAVSVMFAFILGLSVRRSNHL